MDNNITAVSPQISMGVKVQVAVGHNQVQRNAGLYSGLYLAQDKRIGQEYLELAPGDFYTSNSLEQYANIVLSSSGPVSFAGLNVNDIALPLKVKSLLVLDDVIKSFTILNASATDTVRLSLNTVSYVP